MIKDELEAILKRDNEKTSTSTFGLRLNPLYPINIVVNPYSIGYIVLKIQKFEEGGNAREHVVPRFYWTLLL